MRKKLAVCVGVAVGMVVCGLLLWCLRDVFHLTRTSDRSALSPGPPANAAALLKSDFTRDPLTQGWERQANGNQPFEGGWIDVEGKPNSRCLVVRQGYWQSPAVPVTPFQYYRLGFSTKAAGGGYWAAKFYDRQGKELDADVYDSIWASTDWKSQTFCLRAHALAAQMRLRFQVVDKPIQVEQVELESVSAETVRRWADAIAAEIPPLKFAPPQDRCGRLPRTMATLRQGGRLRIVMLGDSICNDMSNSLFETLLERTYPKALYEVIASVRGGAGCQYYKETGRVRDYVLQFHPDLVVIAGISHGSDAESIRSVIRQIRAESTCEVFVLTGGVWASPAEQGQAQAAEVTQPFIRRMLAMTREENVEFLDLGRVWEQYMQQSSKRRDWFHRDEVHANSRGKQALARVLLKYFESDSVPSN